MCRWVLSRLMAGAAALFLATGQGMCAFTTTTFQVQIVIVSSCSIDSATSLNFGTQGSLALGVVSTGTLAVNCNLGVTYNIGLDIGTGSGATVASRKMTGPGSATVSYALYQDILHTTLWGPTIGTNTVPGIGTGLSIPYIVYGQVPVQATPGAGTYTDTITVTVTY